MIQFKNNIDKGRFGEEVACDYLHKNGYNVLNRNFRLQSGEIDIIASNNGLLCIIEVKTRQNTKYGLPCESVNSWKQLRIKKVAKGYISKNRFYNMNVRFDIIEVYMDFIKNTYTINHIKNAFI